MSGIQTERPVRTSGLWPLVPSAQTLVGFAVIGVTAVFVLYPVYYLLQASLDVGDPEARPPTSYGFDNFAALPRYSKIMLNTLFVAFGATVMALVFGFLTAWVLNRTNVPYRRTLEQAMAVPYYVTPLLGALAWSLLGAPESGFVNQIWRGLGGHDAIIDIISPLGIAWVMALFEGSVAFVMIGAVMKSMDPALEEASQINGAGRFYTMLRITLPLVTPGVLGAAIFVFAEMLGSFSAALVLGTPVRFYVITTAIYQLTAQYPPRIPLAAALGVSLFAVMFLMLFFYRRIISRSSFVTVSGKAFRPRLTDVGGLRWVLFGVCCSYVLLSVVLPILTLLYASLQHLAVAFPTAANFTFDNYRKALTQNAVRYAMSNSLLLGVLTATIGVALTGMLSWLIHRSRVPGRGLLEYTVMFPQAVPRLVFAFGMMWAWLVFPIPIYGTLWLLLIAYLTVFLPLGVRTISSVLLQLDKSLEECGEVCGASWAHRMHTITIPLLRPGLLAAWMLLFIASVRELGASILLMGPHSQVLTPAIVSAWFGSSSELTAAMALIQTFVLGIVVALFMLITRRASRQGG
ncbi:MAG: iron(III) transport system permease protein [Acetobacteraceae bacterium]|jgi:iron(III) transport system permease protein|nr:iron(III) transport system permease protein [Acetobacteraceae bacterium]MEA2771304.1 iron(III) transport system permease protein [Acetobacteraceae bacterium]